MREMEKKKEKKRQLQEVLEHIKLVEQTQRNAAIYQQQQAELDTYKKLYGRVRTTLLL